MKPKFKKVMTVLALVSLGITGLASCGAPEEDNEKGTISIVPSWTAEDTLLTNVTYSLKATYSLDENAKIIFSSNAPSVFKKTEVGDNRIDFSFTKSGEYRINAVLEGDATVTSTLNVQIAEGEVSYKLVADTDNMPPLTFEQGSAFNSAGLRVYKVKCINGEETDSRQTLSKDQYKLLRIEEGEEVEILDGETLKISGELDIIVRSNDKNVTDGAFTILVASRPTYLSDQFFAKMTNNYSVYLIGENDEQGKPTIHPWLVRNERYIMSYDSILMGTYGVGFYKDNETVRQFYLDQTNSTSKKEKFIAGRELHVDAGIGEAGTVVRDVITDLDYAKGFFKYTDGTDYDNATFGKEGKAQVLDGQTLFTFSASAKTTPFLTGLIGITELLNYGFSIQPQIAFVESDKLGISAVLSVVITMPNGNRTAGSFLIETGNAGNPDIDEFIASKPTEDKAINPALQKSFDVITGNDFIGSDETNFYDGFVDTETTKDTSYGIYYATPDSYLVSTGYRDSSTGKTTNQKMGVLTVGEGYTLQAGKYAYVANTIDGSDATTEAILENNIAVFNQYMPRNWPGFTTKENAEAVVPGYDFASEWLLQTIPSARYAEYDEAGYPIGEPVGYDYQFRLAGAATSLLWAVLYCATPSYTSLFAGDSLMLNVSTDIEGNLTDLSIVFHGKISEAYQDQMPMLSACNILSLQINLESVGKTVNPHYTKYLESITKKETTK